MQAATCLPDRERGVAQFLPRMNSQASLCLYISEVVLNVYEPFPVGETVVITEPML